MEKSTFIELKNEIKPKLKELGYYQTKFIGTSSQMYENTQNDFTYRCELLTKTWWRSVNGITFHRLLVGLNKTDQKVYHLRVDFQKTFQKPDELERRFHKHEDLNEFIDRTITAIDILMKKIKSESDAIDILLSQENIDNRFIFNGILSSLEMGLLAILNNRKIEALKLLNNFLKNYPMRGDVPIDKIRIEFVQNVIEGLNNGSLDSANAHELLKKYNKKVWSN